METGGARVIYLRPSKPPRPKSPHRLRALVALGVVLLLMLPFARDLWRLRQVRQEMVAVRQEIINIKAESEALRAELEAWQDPEQIERVARERLGLVKPGEVLYYVGEAGNSSTDR